MPVAPRPRDRGSQRLARWRRTRRARERAGPSARDARARTSASASAEARPSVRPRHPEDVLADVGEHEVVADRRDEQKTRLAELALDVVLPSETVATVGIEASVSGIPRRLRCKELGHVRFRAALAIVVEQPRRLVTD